jgi:hypothetical protein
MRSSQRKGQRAQRTALIAKRAQARAIDHVGPPSEFDDQLELWRDQRKAIERAPVLPKEGIERALDHLAEQRTSKALEALTSDEQAELAAEFDLVERALRKHLEN